MRAAIASLLLLTSQAHISLQDEQSLDDDVLALFHDSKLKSSKNYDGPEQEAEKFDFFRANLEKLMLEQEMLEQEGRGYRVGLIRKQPR